MTETNTGRVVGEIPTEFLIDRVDPADVIRGHRHLIAAAIVLAWFDSVGHFESTFSTRKNCDGMKDIAKRWIQGDVEETYHHPHTYKHWMELLDFNHRLEPKQLIEDVGVSLLAWWEEDETE